MYAGRCNFIGKTAVASGAACLVALLLRSGSQRALRCVGSFARFGVDCSSQRSSLTSGRRPVLTGFGNFGVVTAVSLADGRQSASVALVAASLPRFGQLRCA